MNDLIEEVSYLSKYVHVQFTFSRGSKLKKENRLLLSVQFIFNEGNKNYKILVIV